MFVYIIWERERPSESWKCHMLGCTHTSAFVCATGRAEVMGSARREEGRLVSVISSFHFSSLSSSPHTLTGKMSSLLSGWKVIPFFQELSWLILESICYNLIITFTFVALWFCTRQLSRMEDYNHWLVLIYHDCIQMLLVLVLHSNAICYLFVYSKSVDLNLCKKKKICIFPFTCTL